MASEYKSNGSDYKNGEGSAAGEPKKGGKLKAHFKRFWWLHLINIIVGTVLINCLLLFVALPNIAQKGVDDAELTVISQTVADPSPTSIQLSMLTNTHSKSPFTPTLDPFQSVLFLENTEPNIKPFGNITIPSLHVLKDTQLALNQKLEITDMAQFINYNTLVAQTFKYRVALRGATKLHLGALPVVKVNFNKAIEFKGLDNLKGITVTDIKLDIAALPGKPNLSGMLIIPNPTIMTLTLGDLVQDLFLDGMPIGNSTIPNVILKPGNNTFPMTSISDQAAVINMITTKYKTGVIPVVARAQSVTYKGQLLPYFTEALKRSPVSLSLDLGPAFKAIGLDLGALTGGAAGGAAPPPAPMGATPLPSAAPPPPPMGATPPPPPAAPPAMPA